MCLASAEHPKFSHHFLGIGFHQETQNVELVEPFRIKKTRGVSHCGLAIYIKKILRQKKNYGNLNISPCKNIIFKNPLKETKILQAIITLL
jgi:hypothetical protein